MSDTSDPGDNRPAGWTEEDEAWTQAVIEGNLISLGAIADVIEATADSFTVISVDTPAGES